MAEKEGPDFGKLAVALGFLTGEDLDKILRIQGDLHKINPMATWTSRDTYQYMERHGIPTHPLFDQGYASIGCAPCTRPIVGGENERDGRWASTNKVECGLHTFLEPGPDPKS